MNAEKMLRLAQQREQEVVVRYILSDGAERQLNPARVLSCDMFGVALTAPGSPAGRFFPYHEITLVHPVVGA